MDQEKRPIVILATLLVATILLSGTYIVMMGGSDDDDSDIEFAQIKDAMNTTYKFKESPETIISTAPSITETLYAMGYGDKLIAVSDFTTYPQDAVDRMALDSSDPNHLPSMGSYFEPNTEFITDLSADIVFITKTSGSVNVYDSLKDMGQTVVMLHQEESIAEIYKNYWLILTVMNPPSIDMDVTSMMESINPLYDMRDSIEAVKDKMKTGTTDRQFLIHLGWESDVSQDVWAAGTGNFITAAAAMANMTKNTADTPGFAQINKELYIDPETNPEIIISVGWGWTGWDQSFDDWDTMMDTLRNDPVWNSTNAVKNDQVYVFTERAEEITSRATANAYADLVKLMAMIMQPQVFTGFTPDKVIGNNYSDMFDGHW